MKLYLEDGTSYEGTGFGANGNVAGEVVFNTGMAGYVETLTDPSYRGQILLLTYPLVGNYGVPPERPAGSIERPFEADRIQVQGLIVQHYVDEYSHRAAGRSLHQWLEGSSVPGVTGIDTRALTRKLREVGTMRGWLVDSALSREQAESAASCVDMEQEVFDLVSPPEAIRYAGGDKNILLIDVGAKDNIVRSMLERGASVTRLPWHLPFEDHLADCDGVMIGNGPGDPKKLGKLIDKLRDLIANFRGPVFGVCLGHQLLSLAVGGDTYKLPYGHRSVNQPVRDLRTGRCYITSQNHGYAVRDESLPEDCEPWFVNVNDGTNEGMRSKTRPIMSVQFHPEASPGPEDTGRLFDDFLAMAGQR